MNKNIKVLVLSLIIVLSASLFYFTNINETVGTDAILKEEDTRLINNVVEIEKDIVLTQLRSISFKDFKNNTSSFFQSYYGDSYFDEIEKRYNTGSDIAVSTILPLYQYISKVYTSKDGKSKYIYVRIPDKRFANQAAEMYMFIKENSEWKIKVIKNYVLSNDMKKPEKDAEIFTTFDDKPIDYEYIKVLE